jgi:hypothetical protein
VLSFKCGNTVPISLISRSITVPDCVDFFGNTMPLSLIIRSITVPHYVDYFGIAVPRNVHNYGIAVPPDFFLWWSCSDVACSFSAQCLPASVPCLTIKPL